MLARHHDGRRRARAQALHDDYASRPDVAYVDAARYPSQPSAYALSVITTRTPPQHRHNLESSRLCPHLPPRRSGGSGHSFHGVLRVHYNPQQLQIRCLQFRSRYHCSRYLTAPRVSRLPRRRGSACHLSYLGLGAHRKPGNEAAHRQANIGCQLHWLQCHTMSSSMAFAIRDVIVDQVHAGKLFPSVIKCYIVEHWC